MTIWDPLIPHLTSIYEQGRTQGLALRYVGLAGVYPEDYTAFSPVFQEYGVDFRFYENHSSLFNCSMEETPLVPNLHRGNIERGVAWANAPHHCSVLNFDTCRNDSVDWTNVCCSVWGNVNVYSIIATTEARSRKKTEWQPYPVAHRILNTIYRCPEVIYRFSVKGRKGKNMRVITLAKEKRHGYI